MLRENLLKMGRRRLAHSARASLSCLAAVWGDESVCDTAVNAPEPGSACGETNWIVRSYHFEFAHLLAVF